MKIGMVALSMFVSLVVMLNDCDGNNEKESEEERNIITWNNVVGITENWRIFFSQKFDGQKQPVSLKLDLGNLVKQENYLTANSMYVSIFSKKTSQSSVIITKAGFHDDCYQVIRVSNTTLTDCFDLGNADWFGLGELFDQAWPLNEATFKMTSYTTNDYMTAQSKSIFGGVLEPILVNTDGVGIYLSESIPISVSMNDNGKNKLCVQSVASKSVGEKLAGHNLFYTVCLSKNVKKVYDILRNEYIEKPDGYPDLKMLTQPIWSTWVLYKKNINQSLIVEFADLIKKFDFPASHIEIDDMYSSHYGDFDFDPKRFNNVKKLFYELRTRGFRVSVWVYPFCNVGSKCFENSSKYWVLTKDGLKEKVGIIKWWNGEGAILDSTNKKAFHWFKKRLLQFRKFGIAGFKFDAGELNYLPKDYKFSIELSNPNSFSKSYVKLASSTGNLTEVRVGFKSQKYPVFVRILDRSSSWGSKNGLRSVISAALTFSILGYPFVLPDMIGGNFYIMRPSKELYVRWAQLCLFLPGMQFSIPPWKFDDEVMSIIANTFRLRKQISPYLIELAKKVQESGDPIVRPLWWYWPIDRNASKIYTEFMLGDKYLIAPILFHDVKFHRIYLPAGVWREAWGNKKVVNMTAGGGFVLYHVRLSDVPYFELD